MDTHVKFMLPVKNTIAIYDCLFQPLLLKEGLWVQVRVNHGCEFSLMLSVQQDLIGFHDRQDRFLSYRQFHKKTTKQNAFGLK